MKKLLTAVAILAAGIIMAAVYYSPLTGLGDAYEYVNNVPVESIDGLCYARDKLVRVDFEGGESDMYAALDRINAETVKVADCGGAVVVYAYSPRVAARSEKLSDGVTEYNVMAAVRDGTVSIGTPLLSGCY